MGKRFCKIYLEITNLCNLQCSFCPGTRRAPQTMTPAQFARAASEAKRFTDYLYLHLMGEPLLHPALGELLAIGHANDLKINLTTNGVLIAQAGEVLLASPAVRKVGFSLHAYEANRMPLSLERYLSEVFNFCDAAQERGILCELRLWNGDSQTRAGANSCNGEILERIQAHFGSTGTPCRRSGNFVLAQGIYLARAEIFDWPDPQATPQDGGTVFCHGLRDQIGVLADGTVVPCCLDGEGTIALGNLLEQPLDEILVSERAERIYAGFSARRAAEPLCQSCGYAQKF